jgi:hypothetical protein
MQYLTGLCDTTWPRAPGSPELDQGVLLRNPSAIRNRTLDPPAAGAQLSESRRRRSIPAGDNWKNPIDNERTATPVFMTPRLGRQSNTEAMCRVTDGRVVVITVRWPNVSAIVLPRSRPDDMRTAVAMEPRGAVKRRALIVRVPTILYPLIDGPAHIVESKLIGLEATNICELAVTSGVAAIHTIGHPGPEAIAPPIFRSRVPPSTIFPFGLAWKSIVFVRRLR